MSLSHRAARPLLASIFIGGGLDAFLHPDGKVKAAEAVTKPVAEFLSFIPDDPALLVRVNGGAQVVAGALLAVGKYRRLAALTLIGSIVPTTVAGHRFWEEVDPERRAQQQVHFLKNLSLLGGLLLAATDTDGAPSLGWRLRRRAHQVTEHLTPQPAETHLLAS
jgi:putative oxidoreductase